MSLFSEARVTGVFRVKGEACEKREDEKKYASRGVRVYILLG